MTHLRLRLDSDFDDGGGEVHSLQDDRVVRVAEGVARDRVLEPHDSHDVAGSRLLHLRALVC